MPAEGIAKNAAMFRGVIKEKEYLQIVLMNDADEPMSNTPCKVTFQDGQITMAESDDDGILKVFLKTQGEVEIEVLEEETNMESSEGGG